jgi:hypothetical protein
MSRRRYVETNCRTCQQPILVGPDNDTCALNATCDTSQLNRTGELLAIIDGRKTYQIEGQRIHRRDRWQINTEAAHVVAEHRCHNPTPRHWHAPEPSPATTTEVPF